MKAHEIVNNLREALSLLWRAAPKALSLALVSNIVIGLIPSALLYVNAQLIERLTSDAVAATVMALVMAYFILGGFHDGLNAISSFVVDTLRDSASALLRENVIRAVSTFPTLAIHEDAELRETAVLAARASDEIGELISHLYAVSVGCVMIVPLLVLTGQTAWWIPILMVAGMAPTVLCRAQAERESWDVQEFHAATFNELRIRERILTQPEFAKDLRLYRMQSGLLNAWKRLYDAYLASARKVRLRNALKLAGTSIIASLLLGIPLYVVIDGFRAGAFDIAQLAFLLGALVQLKDGLAAIIFNFGDLLRVSYAIRPLRELATLRSERKKQGIQCAADFRPADKGSSPVPCVALRNVDFSYPSTEQAALKRINLEIRSGEVVAVVGENGAGKTTLLKLLADFYEPTGGELVWPAADPQPRVVGVLQDFACFPLSVDENLALKDEQQQAREYLQAVGLEFLEAHLHTPLTTEVSDGTDLSGGQWQRLAIARAMAHADKADLLIFDEPTSALDPESEAEIMRLILQISKQSTAVIVSHRLALTRFVDRIVVLDQGQVIEEGSHDELMRQNGKYARMFESQAMFYQGSLANSECIQV